ncbi:hypothetical protein CANARDRAFT_27913 [[Candida] arabinofermentans NRRL YB-2248]|uniref:Importin N-terminal domain-containing protein n=1 Tax=[Candida] arabinofermentans NRRL YB-2248 TaxID=983967 RepID=A0A1E4T2A5_9ASCO|nr:hypothetical protein CANARDRAFT_27913 [[Candida] arabinofermentans NRRL YB-2248]
MSDWSPDPEALKQLWLILAGTLAPEASVRLEATKGIENAKLQPQFNNYLLHILVNCQTVEPAIRASAGLLMKNDLVKNFKFQQNDLKQHILTELPKGLLDSENMVRNITGNVITSLFMTTGVKEWPNILPNLMELASGAAGTIQSQEGAMSCLAKICEDSSISLDRDYNGERPVNFMIPRFLELCQSPEAKIRMYSLTCLNQFLLLKTQSILLHLDDYMARLYYLTADPDTSVRTKVCTAYANILDARPDKLLANLEFVVYYCITSMKDENDELALEACEFLLGLSTSDISVELIRPMLSNIVSILLEKMVYSEMEVFMIENEDDQDNENVADKEEDIKPQMAKGKEAHKQSSKNAGNSNNENGKVDSDDDYSDDDDDDDDDSDLSFDWNLRKCSAATIDVLATNYPGDVLEVSLPIIKERIAAAEWPVREASILALGAIAEGCLEQASTQLPSLIPFLVDRLKDSETRVRQIACWTLGRYSSWVCTEVLNGGSCANYFVPTFEAIMACALDTKKVVQESACSSLADFIDSSDASLIEQFIEPLLQHFQMYFAKYQRKNLIILYDTVQTFAEKVGDKLKFKTDYIEMLLPPLIKKWELLSDDDKDLWPLLECMSSVAAALGESFAPYAIPVYQRALRILTTCIEQVNLSNDDPNFDAPEKDFIVTSIDLIDGLVQGLTAHSGALIQQFDTAEVSLMKLLIICFDDPTNDIRQSAYALLGDLCIFLLDVIVLPNLHEVMVCIGNEITNRTFASSAACNNAVWALGEISLRVPRDTFKPYLSNFMNVLIPLLISSDVEQTVLENASITIGRFGSLNACDMGIYSPQVLTPWCGFMMYIEENEEKETSFEGMCNIITANPTALNVGDESGRKGLKQLIDCIAIYENPGERLATMFHLLLNGFKSGLGEAGWNSILRELDGYSIESLNVRYGV